MKKYIILLLATTFLLGTSVSSCTNFLEEKPESEFDEGTFYKTVESLKVGAVGAFSTLRYMYNVGTNTPLFVGMVGTDECMYPNETNLRGFIDRYTYTPTDGCIKQFWFRYYRLITACNTVIYKAQGIEGDAKLINRYVANVRFLRAWGYFNLVQTFGAVPLMTGHVTELTYDMGRTPVAEVYQLIEDDLLFCLGEDVLPKEIDGGWANYWAAKTLLAKVYITMASARAADRVAGYEQIEQTDEKLYGDALALLQDVITNSGRDLEPVYGDVFKIENKNINIETILEIQFSAQNPYGSQWPKEYGARAINTDGQKLYGGWRTNAIAGQCNLKYVPSFWNYYDANGYDKRREWNLADYVIDFDKTNNSPIAQKPMTELSGKPQPGDNAKSVTNSGVTKYRWGATWKDEHTNFVYSNCPNNILVLRFADVLLMYAEADLMLNNGSPSDEGVEAMNRIVQRARGLNQGVAVTEDDTPGFGNYDTYTLEDVLLERARELCFERWRWYDLARTGMLEHFLENRNGFSTTKTSFDSDKNYLFPIPLSEIQISTNKDGMYQNPNY